MRQAKGFRSSSSGFTLIELMVVIGIILLLVSIVTFGFRHVQVQAARHETLAEMQVCEVMLKEYTAVNGMMDITVQRPLPPPGFPKIPPPFITVPLGPNASYQVPVYMDNGVSPNWGPRQTLVLPNDTAGGPTGDMGDRGGAGNARYTALAVSRTEAVMFILLKDSKNRAMLSSIPAKRIMEGAPDITTNVSESIPADFSMILDGWGNPIIFVPKGGVVVWMNPVSPGSYFLVRSSGSYLAHLDGTFSLATPSDVNDQPFFASAGQDGIFTDPMAKTDNAVDNIYSFQK